MRRPPAVVGWLDDPGRGSLSFHRRAAGTTHWDRYPQQELAAHVRAAASVLADGGAGTDTAVLVILDTGLPFVGAFFGAVGLGAIPTAVQPPGFLARRAGYEAFVARILSHVRPPVVVAEEPVAEVIRPAAEQAGCRPTVVTPAHLAAGDPATPLPFGGTYALRQLTSGSTGAPKGVLLTAEQLSDHARDLGRWLRLGRDDAGVSWLPLHHDMGLINHLIRPLVLDLDEHLMPPAAFIREPWTWMTTLGEHGTLTTAPTFGYRYLLDRVGDDPATDDPDDPLGGLDLSRCRATIMGAERIDADVVARFRARFAPCGLRPSAVLPAYGLAEATLTVSGTPPGDALPFVCVPARPAAIGDRLEVVSRGVVGDEPVDRPPAVSVHVPSGPPLAGTRVTIEGDGGVALPDGTLGEIVVESRGVGVIETAPAPRTEPPPGGAQPQPQPQPKPQVQPQRQRRLRTGDAGFVLDGRLYVLGRLGDSLSVRGQRVFAETIETEMASVIGRDVAVVVGDDAAGPAVVSFVDTELTDDQVQQLHRVAWRCLDRQVRSLVVRATRGSLPRTSSGKPQRRRIWAQYTSGRFEQQLLGASDRAASLVGDPEA